MARRTILIAALALVSCEKPQTTGLPVTAAEAARIAEGAEANFTKGDVNAVMAQYAKDAVMIDAASPQPSRDRNIQTGWAKTFVSMQPADYRVIDRQIQLLCDDAFISTGIETFTVTAGAARPTVSARFTDVFQRQRDGNWKIVNEHVSMPPQQGTAVQ